MSNDLVYLSTAANQTEAGALRSYLEAYGIHAHVQGEHHSSLLGPLGAFAIELRILVPAQSLDEARELMRAFYEAEPVGDELEEVEAFAEADEVENLAPSRVRATSPTTAGALALFPGFGLGHVVTGAAARGFGLMALEVVGIAWIAGGDLTRGVAAVIAAIALDFIGAMRRARDQNRALMPTARLRQGDGGSAQERP